MKCTKCKSEMAPVGLGDCNGWRCKCGNIEHDIASFKLSGGDFRSITLKLNKPTKLVFKSVEDDKGFI